MKLFSSSRRTKEPVALRSLKGKAPTLFILLSGKYCNQRCAKCLTDSGPKRKKEVASPETANIILQNLSSRFSGKKEIGFSISGGEPMLNPDFIVSTVHKLEELYGGVLEKVSLLPVITNGTIAHEKLFKKLEAIKRKIMVFYSEDEYHRPPKKIREFKKQGFLIGDMRFASLATYGKKDIVVGMGRGFDLSSEAIDINFRCESAGMEYKIEAGKIISRNVSIPRQRFMVHENGGLSLCGLNGPVFGNLLQNNLEEIIFNLKTNEEALALMGEGPLRLAEKRGLLESAKEQLKKGGPCSICHALKEGILK